MVRRLVKVKIKTLVKLIALHLMMTVKGLLTV